MKLTALIISFLCICSNALAMEHPGLRFIEARGEIRCGTDISSKAFAYKDENGFWKGIDVDLCRIFSTAIFGNPEHYKMINVSEKDVPTALRNNRIDVMLGNISSSAKFELTGNVNTVDIMYYGKQMFLARKIDGATSMQAYKGKKVCAQTNTEDLQHFEVYNRKYALGMQPLLFKSQKDAKEAFLLKRCDLIIGNELYLKNMLVSVKDIAPDIVLLPEIITEKPVYAYVSSDNNKLRLVLKWVFNAIVLAETQEMNRNNIDTFIGITDPSTRNLLGIDKELWQAFGVQPDWLKTALKQVGNYGEIFEKNLGKESPFEVKRDKNKLLQDGGLIKSQPFL